LDARLPLVICLLRGGTCGFTSGLGKARRESNHLELDANRLPGWNVALAALGLVAYKAVTVQSTRMLLSASSSSHIDVKCAQDNQELSGATAIRIIVISWSLRFSVSFYLGVRT
jgi:hypothetical protein